MIDIYCRDRHGAHDALCPECAELRDYALARLDKCPFQESKSTCANCTVHCYKPDMRQRVREVMRYAGPRMMWRHPILALVAPAHRRSARARAAGQESECLND